MSTLVIGAVGGLVALHLARRARAAPARARIALGRSPRCRRRLPALLRDPLQRALDRSELQLGPEEAMVWWLGGTASATVLAAGFGPTLAVGTACCGLFGAPLALISIRHRRGERLRSALPDLLDAVALELRSAGSLQSALQRVSSSSGAVGTEAVSLLRRLDWGQRLDDALGEWRAEHERTPAADTARVVAAALSMASATRSTDPISGTAEALRADDRVREEARALAAQGRLSARILGVLPLAALTLTALLDPVGSRVLVGHPLGRVSLVAGLGLEAAGILWMRRIVRVVP